MMLPPGTALWFYMAAVLVLCPSVWGQSFEAKEYLLAHNRRRCRHNVPDLMWSDAVAASAQRWADQCLFAHSPGRQYGENVWGGRSMPKAEDVLGAWYDNEMGRFDPEDPDAPATGHFTQVVWGAVKYVGCGVCTAGATWRVLVVCHYDPYGNVGGAYAANVPPVQRTAAECARGSQGLADRNGTRASPRAAPCAGMPDPRQKYGSEAEALEAAAAMNCTGARPVDGMWVAGEGRACADRRCPPDPSEKYDSLTDALDAALRMRCNGAHQAGGKWMAGAAPGDCRGPAASVSGAAGSWTAPGARLLAVALYLLSVLV